MKHVLPAILVAIVARASATVPPPMLSTAEATEAVEYFLTEALLQLRRYGPDNSSREPLRTVILNCGRYQEILLWKAPRPRRLPPPRTWADPQDPWGAVEIARLLVLGCGDDGARAVVELVRDCLEAEREAAALGPIGQLPGKMSPLEIHASRLGDAYLMALQVTKSNRLPDALVHFVRNRGRLPINEMRGVTWQEPALTNFEIALRELAAKEPRETERINSILASIQPKRPERYPDSRTGL